MHDLWFQHLSSSLAKSGQAAYLWDAGADRFSWTGDVHGIFGLSSAECPVASNQFHSLINPQNVPERMAALHDFLKRAERAGEFSAAYKIRRPNGHQVDIEETAVFGSAAAPGQKILCGLLKIKTKQDARTHHDYSSTTYCGRSVVQQMIEQWVDRPESQRSGVCYLLVIGMDRLSLMNETFGARYVDEIIEKTQARLWRIIGDSGRMARIDGDVFAVFFENGLQSEMPAMAQHMLSNFYEIPLQTSKGPMAVSVSIGGIDVSRKICSTGISPLVRAERAMRAAKEKGRNCFVSYEQAASQAADNRFLFEAGDKFVRALKDNRVRLAFQPVMDPHANVVSFHECLTRMLDENGNIIAAADFLPAVEKMGLSRLVDQFALKEAIHELNLFSDLNLSVNVSNVTLMNQDWLRGLVAALRDKPSVARRLIIEITETAIMSDMNQTRRIVKTLQDMGCRVALDDFGSGYTAFAQLKDLDIDIVKIDKSFIRNMEEEHNHLFIRTLQTLADGFGLETVGEGVESAADVSRLVGDGINHLQGFAYGFPRIERLWLPENHAYRNISLHGHDGRQETDDKNPEPPVSVAV